MQTYIDTQAYQSQLARFCRTGQWEPIPGVHVQHVQQYRRLVYNVIDDMLLNAYPLVYACIEQEEWNELVQLFFSEHNCQSPQVWYMPKEFYLFLHKRQHPLLQKYPQLLNVMEYEWAEIALFMMEDIAVTYTTFGDVLFSKLILNPEHCLLHLTYPVHQKKVNTIHAEDKSCFYVIGHRNREGAVLFTDLSPALVRMIEYLAMQPLSVMQLIQQLENEYAMQLTEKDKNAVLHFFEVALQKQLLLGFSVSSEKKVFE
ncbi:MAG: putative DNA-binding domain-containing protein [Bacteroidota bacterium]|nr:putative DNA-binding domain-containing protein [Bacteroidota bacterium]